MKPVYIIISSFLSVACSGEIDTKFIDAINCETNIKEFLTKAKEFGVTIESQTIHEQSNQISIDAYNGENNYLYVFFYPTGKLAVVNSSKIHRLLFWGWQGEITIPLTCKD